MSKFETDLYFEAHVTIEPVFEERLEQFRAIAGKHGFRVAELLMAKRMFDAPERSKYDTFATGRGTDYSVLLGRMVSLVVEAQEQGFRVWRYKLENTLLDVRLSH